MQNSMTYDDAVSWRIDAVDKLVKLYQQLKINIKYDVDGPQEEIIIKINNKKFKKDLFFTFEIGKTKFYMSDNFIWFKCLKETLDICIHFMFGW